MSWQNRIRLVLGYGLYVSNVACKPRLVKKLKTQMKPEKDVNQTFVYEYELRFWVQKTFKGEFQKICVRLRPYHAEYTGSRSIPEAKQRWARSVLGWETTWEHRVLYAPYFHRILCLNWKNFVGKIFFNGFFLIFPNSDSFLSVEILEILLLHVLCLLLCKRVRKTLKLLF
jgi:hypothetical protein